MKLIVPLAWLLTVHCFALNLWAQQIPSEVLPLGAWKLTLPIDTDRPSKPDEVLQPELNRFSDPQLFHVKVMAGIAAVAFAAPCEGVTTGGSEYPRTELREMQPDGTTRASWGVADGSKHSLTARLAVTQAPPVKPHVICAQIHNEDKKLLAIRFENSRIIAEGEGQEDVRIVPRYTLGTPFSLQIVAHAGEIVVRYDDREVVRWTSKSEGCYFKIGCYTQSNPKRGDLPHSLGEVVVYDLKLKHAD